jgi:hypothetical protein
MTIIQAVALGLGVGTLGTTGVFIWIEQKSKKWEVIQDNQAKTISTLASIQADIHKGEIELQKNLTAPDLLMVACSQEYLEKNDDLLCREMFCRLQTREGDGAAQSECEEIANVSNSLTVLNSCTNLGIELETCVDYIGKRK